MDSNEAEMLKDLVSGAIGALKRRNLYRDM